MSSNGCIYWDESSRGAHGNLAQTPYKRGRWVGEKYVNGKRVRMRSKDYGKVMEFLGMEPKEAIAVLNGLKQLKGHPNYYADVAKGEVYSYQHGRFHKMKVYESAGGLKSVQLSKGGKSVVRSLNRLIYAAIRGIDVDVIPDDIIIRCSEEKGYYLEYRSTEAIGNTSKRQRYIVPTIERNMMESELMFGYYTKGDSIRVMEYVLSLSEDMVRYAQRRFYCKEEKARIVTDMAIDDFLARLKDGTMVSTSITGTLRTMVCAAYRREQKTVGYSENRTGKSDY